MAETVSIDRPSVAKPVSRPGSRKPATVSACALALHCSRTYIGKLEAEGDGALMGWSGCAGTPAEGRRWKSATVSSSCRLAAPPSIRSSKSLQS